MASQVTPDENSPMQVKERIESSINNDMSRRAEKEYISMDQTPPETRETDLQIQQILDAEPVAMQNLAESETTETEAPSWVNSHILELSNTYGVAFEGFEKETLALLMRIDERKSMLDNKGKEITTTTPKSRGIGKNELKNLQSSLNKEKWKVDVVCLQETQLNKGIEEIAKQLWACRWMRCGYIEADGSNGGILIMWDSRTWAGTKVEEGNYSITYKFESIQNSFSWFFIGVYDPLGRSEKLECWEEMAAMKELSEGPWVTSGDFNIVRHMEERRGCTRVTNIMTDFSKWIEDLEIT
ncbi:hypothetical protein KY285_008543 [Solanum tuberosum]|nr:hypothetical protein KY285_008543 [Solanum tuberosum]